MFFLMHGATNNWRRWARTRPRDDGWTGREEVLSEKHLARPCSSWPSLLPLALKFGQWTIYIISSLWKDTTYLLTFSKEAGYIKTELSGLITSQHILRPWKLVQYYRKTIWPCLRFKSLWPKNSISRDLFLKKYKMHSGLINKGSFYKVSKELFLF